MVFLKIIEPGDNNNLSFSEFLENIEQENVKKRIFVDQGTIFFEPKRSRINLKSGLKEYDRLRYSVTVPESDWPELKQTLEEKGYIFEIVDF